MSARRVTSPSRRDLLMLFQGNKSRSASSLLLRPTNRITDGLCRAGLVSSSDNLDNRPVSLSTTSVVCEQSSQLVCLQELMVLWKWKISHRGSSSLGLFVCMVKAPHLAGIRFQFWHIPSLITGSFEENDLNVTKGTTNLYGTRYYRDLKLYEATPHILWVDQVSYASAAT